LVLGSTIVSFAQEDTITLDELVKSAQDWANANLDQDALRVLQNADQQKVRQVLYEIQRQLHGQYVVDLAPLKDAVRTALPLLEQYEETLPYASWLKSQLDYLDVADQFRLIIPPPKVEPGKPPKPRTNPTPDQERKVWTQKLSERPLPKAAEPYIGTLKPVFVEEHIPPELIWVAEVESSFDPRARSPAGAAGLFQLMPATARRFGLRLLPFDQRLKPEESARATAKYLRFLHSQFGDWRLALAAYNAGEGTVQKLLTHSRQHTFDAISPKLPAETQMFVPRVEAVVLRREGLTLQQLSATRAGA
jgi:membrane-bound lytic murein transglycosylase D